MIVIRRGTTEEIVIALACENGSAYIDMYHLEGVKKWTR